MVGSTLCWRGALWSPGTSPQALPQFGPLGELRPASAVAAGQREQELAPLCALLALAMLFEGDFVVEGDFAASPVLERCSQGQTQWHHEGDSFRWQLASWV